MVLLLLWQLVRPGAHTTGPQVRTAAAPAPSPISYQTMILSIPHSPHQHQQLVLKALMSSLGLLLNDTGEDEGMQEPGTPPTSLKRQRRQARSPPRPAQRCIWPRFLPITAAEQDPSGH